MACSTLARVAALTCGWSLMTLETVIRETPAARATSCMVTTPERRDAGAPPSHPQPRRVGISCILPHSLPQDVASNDGDRARAPLRCAGGGFTAARLVCGSEPGR